ncbi:hypothetical protein EYC84_004638 [Monilinia fructicola]|uniref:3'-5' exonuclease domain-containing protein n=1 Tax=Monilinia fructicola TaxID=38448 RepID=A0A5M9K9C5_MONFR|nr:hypothetical protein EYC84_004638 [Monilinia fructicola]
MLPSNHGAYTLGKSLRQPIMKNISSFVGKSNFASIEGMGSAIAGMSGKRASPSLARSISSNSPKTWQPSHGIVFKDNSAPSSSRVLSTAAVADNEQNFAFHSYAEESYVLTNSHVENSKTRTATTVASEEISKSEEAADVQEILDEIQEDPEKNEPPVSDSTYQMSGELFRQAKEATPETPGSFWSHTLYRGPEENGIPKKVKVHYCRTLQTTERTLKQYFLGHKVLGFDIEWKADARTTDPAKKNVSLIQLATEERIGLFHIALYPADDVSKLVAPTMKQIMEDPEVTKVGVAISADCVHVLENILQLIRFPYSNLAIFTDWSTKQVEDHLHLPLYKGGKVRSSDWSRELSIQQISYAASDSYAGYHLYGILESKRQALDPMPPRPCHADENRPISTLTSSTTSNATRRKYTRRKPTVDVSPLDPEFSIGDPEPTLEVPLDALNETETEKETKVIDSTPDLSITSNLSSKALTSNLETPTKTESVRDTRSTPTRTEGVPTSYSTLDSESSSNLETPTKKGRVRRTRSTSNPESSSILIAADILVAFHFNSNPKSQLKRLGLKAYFIWYHNPRLSLSQVARLLSEKKTALEAAKIILDAIHTGDLPYDKERLRTLTEILPEYVAWSHYRGLLKAIDTPTV